MSTTWEQDKLNRGIDSNYSDASGDQNIAYSGDSAGSGGFNFFDQLGLGNGKGDFYTTMDGSNYIDDSPWWDFSSTDTRVSGIDNAKAIGNRTNLFNSKQAGLNGNRAGGTNSTFGNLYGVANFGLQAYGAYNAHKTAKENNRIQRETLEFNKTASRNQFNADALMYNKYSSWQDRLAGEVNRNRMLTGEAGLQTEFNSKKIDEWLPADKHIVNAESPTPGSITNNTQGNTVAASITNDDYNAGQAKGISLPKNNSKKKAGLNTNKVGL